MERKEHCKEEEMVQTSKITINGNNPDHDFSDKDDDESLDILKKEISCHCMYGEMLESHLDCLKTCLGKMEKIENVGVAKQYSNVLTAEQSELDQFMEAYCVTLKKLKEAIEEPQQESMAFINLMHSQLQHLLLHYPSSS